MIWLEDIAFEEYYIPIEFKLRSAYTAKIRAKCCCGPDNTWQFVLKPGQSDSLSTADITSVFTRVSSTGKPIELPVKVTPSFYRQKIESCCSHVCFEDFVSPPRVCECAKFAMLVTTTYEFPAPLTLLELYDRAIPSKGHEKEPLSEELRRKLSGPNEEQITSLLIAYTISFDVCCDIARVLVKQEVKGLEPFVMAGRTLAGKQIGGDSELKVEADDFEVKYGVAE
jgi:hypothetical protein